MVKPPSASLRAAFEIPSGLTVGIEEEVMLVDAATLDLAPRAGEVLEALGGDPRFKLEMPAAHLEIVLPPLASAADVAHALLAARRDLAAACEPLGLLVAAAGVHPFAAPRGPVNGGPRYESMVAEFGDVARSQLVCALQVHVAVRPADRAMAVYNALRPFLPLISALAANGPIFEGRDTVLASKRPAICELLPQQGMPPALTWDSYAAAAVDPARWWWELRPHPAHGTLEVRVPDAQATVEEAAAVVGVVHALVAKLADDAGAPAPASPPSAVGAPAAADRAAATAALQADRRVAFQHGLAGPLGPRVRALLDDLAPHAERVRAAIQLESARALAARGGGAARQRAVFARGGARAVVDDLVKRFAQD
ncbi:MAG TPA: YbdK family carboxylate-amine ligase [Solirubrobacteraceae bacterium]